MKKVLSICGITLGVLVFIVALAGFIRFNFTDGGDIIPGTNAPDIFSLSYRIGDETFILKNGIGENRYTDGSASVNKLSIFGEPTYGDLDNDDDIDAVVLLVNEPGGSGAFYYAVLVLNDGSQYHTTNGMFLGDRIAPQTVEIQEGRAVINFAERRVDEPMTTPPSIGRSVWIHYDTKTNEIGEWVKDFEGEER
jgi:hypothetical protein